MRKILAASAKVAAAAKSAQVPNEAPVCAEEARKIAGGLSNATWWRMVRDGRMPQPVYPAPRAPRWYSSEIRTALAATRMLPSRATALRRGAGSRRPAA